MVGFGTGQSYVVYFVGAAAEELVAELAGFFAFFFLAFLVVPDFAGAGVDADAWCAGGEAVVVPCANATAENAVTTSAASKCFMMKFQSLVEKRQRYSVSRPLTDAYSWRLTMAACDGAGPMTILPYQSAS